MKKLGPKVLTICEHGNSRSVGLAYLLKHHSGQGVGPYEAIPIGVRRVSPDTFRMLIGWADNVILTDAALQHLLPDCGGKLLIWDVGADVYFRGIDQRLLDKYQAYLDAFPRN